MTDRNLRVKISLDTAALRAETAQAAEAFDKIGKSAKAAGTTAQKATKDAASDAEQSGSRIGSAYSGGYGKASDAAGLAARAGTYVGLAVAGGAVLAGKAILDIGISYEKQMNTLQAVTGASDATMRQVSDTATALGNAIDIPGASAADAAQAMTELAKGGFDVQQAMTAARGTLQLAAAAQISGAEAAQIQATAMNAFSLQADQAGHVADVLANVANAASGSIQDFAAGMQQSAGVAASFGISIDDSATVLGLFAKNGMLGSDAGTSFKTSLIALASPTKQQAAALDDLGIKVYDAQGKFVGMRVITDDLAKASKSMTQEQFNMATSTAFGSDAMRAAGFLAKEGATGYDTMRDSVTKAGGAQELAAAQTKGVTGAWNALTNTLETGAIGAFQALAPVMTAVLTAGNGLIGMITAIPTPVLVAAASLGAVAVLRGPLDGLWKSVKSGAETAALSMMVARDGAGVMGVAMSAAGTAVKGMGAALKGAFLSNPIGLALTVITTAISLFAGSEDAAASSTTDLSAVVDAQTGAFKENAKAALAAALETDGTAQKMREAGIPAGMLTDALLKGGGAADQLAAILQGNLAKAQAEDAAASYYTADGYYARTDATNKAQAAIDAFAQKQGDLNSAVTSGKNVQSEATTTLTGWGSALATIPTAYGALGAAIVAASNAGTGPIGALTAAQDAYKRATDGASASTDYLTLSMQLLAGKNVDAETLARANGAAMRDIGQSARDLADANQNVTDKTAALSKAQRDHGKNSSEAAAAQRDLDNAIAGVGRSTDAQAVSYDKAAATALQVTDQAYRQAKAHGTAKDAIAAATSTMAVQREQFILSAIDANTDRAAAEKLADAQGLIPANVATTYEAKGAQEAADAAKRIQDAIDKIPAYKSVTVSVGQIGTSISSLTSQLGSIFTGHAFTGGNVGAIMAGARGFAGGGAIGGAAAPSNPRMDNLLAYDESGHPLKVRSDEWVVNGSVSNALGPQIMSNFNSGMYGRDFFTGNSSVTHNVFGAAPQSSPVSADQIIAALGQAGPRVTQLSEHLVIQNHTTDSNAGLNDALFRLLR